MRIPGDPPVTARPGGLDRPQTAGRTGEPVDEEPGAGLSTAPAEPARTAGSLGPAELARWVWRQLTSMRTALILLLLLGLAAVPGSLVPQRGISPARVARFAEDNPTLAAVYDRLHLFDVYAAPWFAAIYLLLFVSLVGCFVPRIRMHAQALRAAPPAAPRVLSRLPVHRAWTTTEPPAQVLAAATAQLRRRRYRVATSADDGSVAGEAGYWRETGNLLFHVALLGLLLSVGAGSLLGWRASVLQVEGQTVADTVPAFDTFTRGALVTEGSLAPFTVTLDSLRVTYAESGPRVGEPRDFRADVSYRRAPGDPVEKATISVNGPLRIGDTKIFLTGNGYAPMFTVRDAGGRVAFQGAVPFLPRDMRTFTSAGVVKVPDITPRQLGFTALFLPTAYLDPVRGPVSVFPDARNPEVFLGAYTGDLGIDSGVPQSVYELDTAHMKLVANGRLAVGQTLTLPDGLGSITYDGWRRFANFQIAEDPGRMPALVTALAALGGLMLSLFVRRRRVWVRATPDEAGRTLVEIAGLARSDSAPLSDEVDDIVRSLGGSGPPTDADGSTHGGPSRSGPTQQQED